MRATWPTLTPRLARRNRPLGASLLLTTLALVGCTSGTASLEARPATPDTSAPRSELVSYVEVHRSPGCGCCHEWEAYLRDHGYEVSAADDRDIVGFKADHGVPSSAQSCHTALIDGYIVEGHVPVAAIEDLLRERPAIDGIALPGMPPGSPGMSGVKEGPFEVLAFANGEVTPFGSY